MLLLSSEYYERCWLLEDVILQLLATQIIAQAGMAYFFVH